MIKYLKGTVEDISIDEIILEVGGIGYGIKVPVSVIDSIRSTGIEAKLYTYMSVKEDGVNLFGFLSKDDLDMFKKIISVSGIGPKGGIAILSTLPADDLRFAILSNDAKAIAKSPGIGAKTASKLILELKDKVNLEDAFEKKSINVQNANVVNDSLVQDATEALIALGYSSSDALKAVRYIEINENASVQEIIKDALKIIGTL